MQRINSLGFMVGNWAGTFTASGPAGRSVAFKAELRFSMRAGVAVVEFLTAPIGGSLQPRGMSTVDLIDDGVRLFDADFCLDDDGTLSGSPRGCTKGVLHVRREPEPEVPAAQRRERRPGHPDTTP